jgi:hypothetical protein
MRRTKLLSTLEKIEAFSSRPHLYENQLFDCWAAVNEIPTSACSIETVLTFTSHLRAQKALERSGHGGACRRTVKVASHSSSNYYSHILFPGALIPRSPPGRCAAAYHHVLCGRNDFLTIRNAGAPAKNSPGTHGMQHPAPWCILLLLNAPNRPN